MVEETRRYVQLIASSEDNGKVVEMLRKLAKAKGMKRMARLDVHEGKRWKKTDCVRVVLRIV